MVKAKKGKHAHLVTYVRLTPQARAQISKIVEERGYPHTIASIAAEMITKGLAATAPATSEEA